MMFITPKMLTNRNEKGRSMGATGLDSWSIRCNTCIQHECQCRCRRLILGDDSTRLKMMGSVMTVASYETCLTCYFGFYFFILSSS